MPMFTIPIHEHGDPTRPGPYPHGSRGDTALARPTALFLGGPDSFRVTNEAVQQYLERYGEEHRAAPLPVGVQKGPPRNCYQNATRLVMDNHLEGDGTLRYAEGVAYPTGNPGFGVLHGWAVTPNGTVIDNTLDAPEQARYFGVAYEQPWYLKFIMRSGTYGVMGGDDEAAEALLKERGIDPTAVDPRMAELRKQLRAHRD